ncbi:hypothetical protein NUSPORA_01172 [Nucleospora cyclopteri]
MKEHKVEKRRKDPSDFATVDKVLDNKSVKILTSLQNRKKLFNLSGSISTGKEASIFTGMSILNLNSKFTDSNSDENKEKTADLKKYSFSLENSSEPINLIPVAIKIFKTSTMFFKDRSKYIENEKRFSNFCTSNSRKLIKIWAEKEVRNLKRLIKNGIPCPVPIYLKKNIIVMNLIGDVAIKNNIENSVLPDISSCSIDFIPAVRLKDSPITENLYFQAVEILKNMFLKANLVHADFSEYNLLVYREKVYVIDVGQSIDKDHENAFYFLITDITNINSFFRSKKIDVSTENDIFIEITGLRIPAYLKDIKLNKNSFIPSSLSEIANAEDVKLFMSDESISCDSIEDSLESSNLTATEIADIEILKEETVEFTGNQTINYFEENKDKIDICKRKMNNIKISQNENKTRKRIVKEMNKERRKNRSEKKKKKNEIKKN